MRYDNIINLPRHISKRHAPMSRGNRAAQFSPFSALTGYDDIIAESGRLTDARHTLDEDEEAVLSDKINILIDNLRDRPEVTIRCFVPDKLKSGGSVRAVSGKIRVIEPVERVIVFADGTRIPFDSVVDISAELFGKYEMNK